MNISLDYIGMTVYQFLETKLVFNQRKEKKLKSEITAESNEKMVNYQEITLNLKNGTFRPYYKPYDQIQHLHT